MNCEHGNLVCIYSKKNDSYFYACPLKYGDVDRCRKTHKANEMEYVEYLRTLKCGCGQKLALRKAQFGPFLACPKPMNDKSRCGFTRNMPESAYERMKLLEPPKPVNLSRSVVGDFNDWGDLS